MTEEELEAEIAEITTAMSYIRKGGQSYTINSGSSTRTVTMVNYETLKKERNDLLAELAAVQGTSGMTLGAGW